MCLQSADIIRDDETLEDLQVAGLSVIQKKDGFRFGIDAVLLSDFGKSIRAEEMLDMCTGCGIVPILLSAKTKIPKIFGMEIQEEIFDAAKRSVDLNGLSGRVTIDCGDIKNGYKIYGKRRFDLITCNPPYMPKGTAVTNELTTKIIARHEVMCTLEDVIESAAFMLKQYGHFVLVHKPTRTADILCLMRKYEIEPKRIRFVHKTYDAEPSLVLVDGAYKGGSELRILPPLFLFDEKGEETEELKRIYGK